MGLSDDFKDALSSWASGVSVVSAQHDGGVYGLTVSSFSSVSLDPPLVSVCIGKTSRLCDFVNRGGRFGVSILAAQQAGRSGHFSTPGRAPDRANALDESVWVAMKSGHPVVRHAVAQLDCELFQTFEAGDHVVYLGRVVEARSDATRRPLVYYRRGYRVVSADS